MSSRIFSWISGVSMRRFGWSPGLPVLGSVAGVAASFCLSFWAASGFLEWEDLECDFALGAAAVLGASALGAVEGAEGSALAAGAAFAAGAALEEGAVFAAGVDLAAGAALAGAGFSSPGFADVAEGFLEGAFGFSGEVMDLSPGLAAGVDAF